LLEHVECCTQGIGELGALLLLSGVAVQDDGVRETLRHRLLSEADS
jgi:hypothetical protein